ncbi:TPA: hypothetical protein HA249_04880 [Candidatus Woesearchaeota archaeon]|nr:MAG: hypothetical protein QT07_C0001G0012 [archaeon GW2011_AR16]HIG96189.1 hypothetical protein [Candidatus Woesearchaeota archaeon]HIH47021.1 hypothetical protein [Candidatus Woesearchaeota archaeon]HII88567.1 hypothetical protein [Candidatus Woesearchaeota archaeon]
MGSFIRIIAGIWLVLAVIVGVVSWIALEELTGTEEIVQKEIGDQEANDNGLPAFNEQEGNKQEEPLPNTKSLVEPVVILKTRDQSNDQPNQTNETKQNTETSERQRARKYTYLIDLNSVRSPYCKKLEKEFLDKEKETEREIRALKATEEDLKEDVLDQQEQVEIARSIAQQDPADYNKRAVQTEKKRFKYLRDELKEVQDHIERKEIYLRQIRQTLGAVRIECDRLYIAGKRD